MGNGGSTLPENRLVVLGLGHAGCRIIEALAAGSSRGPVLAAAHTSARALGLSGTITRIQIGASRTRGLGTGGDVELGRKAAETDRERWRHLLRDREALFLIVGLGGGTGTGAAPVVLETAREMNVLSVCVALLPMEWEGLSHVERARKTLPELERLADIFLPVPNERLTTHTAERQAASAFRESNRVLAGTVEGLWKALARPGYIVLDWAHFQRFAKGVRSPCALGCGEGRGRTRAALAVESLLNSPLLESGSRLARAQAVLITIAAGEDLLLKEIGDVMTALQERIPKESEVFKGTVVDGDAKGALRLTAMAAEAWVPPAAEPELSPTPSAVAPAAAPASPTGRRPVQTHLKLNGPARGRFQALEPTIYEGEDLDIPTFLRRGLSIEP